MDQLVLCAGSPGQAAAIAEETIKSIYPRYYPAGAVRFFLDLHCEERIRAAVEKEEIYLAAAGGELVGTGTIRGNEICRLFILPPYQSRGYGSRLMDMLEEKIFKRYPAVHIDASLPAESMYLKRGYQITSYEKIETENGDFLCYHIMEKKNSEQIATADEIEIRPIRREEYPLLDDFLYDAIYLPEGAAPPPREIIKQPELAVYVEDFGRRDDLCLAAEADGRILGAVWTRILAGEIKGYGNIDAVTPEFAISVKKEFRRQGIGGRLMEQMISLLKKQGYEKASLSVDKDNYAYRMYGKLGFQVVKERDHDYLMVLDLK